MGASESEAKLAINLEGNTREVSDGFAEALEGVRAKAESSQNAIKDYQQSLRGLKGKSDEVVAAKKELNAKMAAEEAALNASNLALLKAGTSYGKLAEHAKKLAAAKKADAEKMKQESASLKAAGGPISSLRDHFDSLKTAVGTSAGQLALFAGIAAGAIAVVAALAAGALAAAVAFTKFAISGANANRSANLLREAVTGSAADAERLGSQVDALAGKIPTARAEIGELANSLRKSGLGGQLLVDTLNAVGQAGAALGKDTGAKLQEIIERSKITGRVGINPMELMGSGVAFQDIAKTLADQMHVGVKAATSALFDGRVEIGAAAKAIRTTVEKQVGGINLRQMLDLNVISAKVGESLDRLTKGIKLDKLLEGFGKFADLLSESTVTGDALKKVVTVFGQGIVDSMEKGVPIAKAFFQGCVIGGLQTYIAFLKLKNAVKDVFGGSTLFADLDTLKISTKTAQVLVGGLAAALVVAAAPLVVLGAAAYGVAAPFIFMVEMVGKAKDAIVGVDWKGLGSSVVSGIVDGLKGGANALKAAVMGLGEGIKSTFKDVLLIGSPSKVFADYGRNTTEGYTQGVDDSAAGAQSSVAAMVAPPSPGASSGRGSGGGPASITVNIEINAGGGAKELSEPSFLAKVTKAVEDALTGAGIPVQA